MLASGARTPFTSAKGYHAFNHANVW